MMDHVIQIFNIQRKWHIAVWLVVVILDHGRIFAVLGGPFVVTLYNGVKFTIIPTRHLHVKFPM